MPAKMAQARSLKENKPKVTMPRSRLRTDEMRQVLQPVGHFLHQLRRNPVLFSSQSTGRFVPSGNLLGMHTLGNPRKLESMVIYNEWRNPLRHWNPVGVHALISRLNDWAWPIPLLLETQQGVTVLVPDYKVRIIDTTFTEGI